MNRLDFLQNHSSIFFLNGINQQLPICRTSGNDNVPGLYSRIANFMYGQPVEVVSFPQKQTFFSQKPLAAVHSSRYWSLFSINENKRECQLLGSIPRNYNKLGGKSRKLHFRMTCLDN